MTAALTHPLDGTPADISLPIGEPWPTEAAFAALCGDRAALVRDKALTIAEAGDELQGIARLSGFADRAGQDRVQRIMSEAFAAVALLPAPTADPGPCQLCGFTIDQHQGEGQLCPEVLHADAFEILRRWEMADPRDAWRHTGEPPPPEHVRNSDISPRPNKPQHYRTPEATRNAFWFVVGQADPERLKAWLADHPRDARFLIKLLESK